MKELETAKREENYNHFIKECVRDLKTIGHCYVYSKAQMNEVLEKFKDKVIVESNECGYTIKKDRRVKK